MPAGPNAMNAALKRDEHCPGQHAAVGDERCPERDGHGPNSSLAADCSPFVTQTAPTVSTEAAAVKMPAVDPGLNAAMPTAHPAGKRSRGGTYRTTLARESSPRLDPATQRMKAGHRIGHPA